MKPEGGVASIEMRRGLFLVGVANQILYCTQCTVDPLLHA